MEIAYPLLNKELKEAGNILSYKLEIEKLSLKHYNSLT